MVISEKKWFCKCIYRPPNYNNLSTFFDEITLSLNKAALKFENFIVMGDFNIDVNASGPGKDKLDEFCNLLDLTNLVTCCATSKSKGKNLEISFSNVL